MKDTKTVLKEAREAIKNKDFQTSLTLCKSILKEDRCNYMALVFLGLSLQEVGPSERAPNAFKQAIEANPDNPLAWNGLVNYYEKIDTVDAKNELTKAYCSLLKLETNEQKLLEHSQKLTNLSNYGNTIDIANVLYELCLNEKYAGKSPDWWLVLVNLLSKIDQLPEELIPMFEEALKNVSENPKTACIEVYKTYLNFLHKQSKTNRLLEEAETMYKLFSTDSISLNWICKLFNENYVETNNLIKSLEVMDKYCDGLFVLEPQSAMGFFAKSIVLINEHKFIEAVDKLQQVVTIRPGLLHAWILLCKCYIKIHFYSEAIQAANSADKLLQTINSCKKNLRTQLDCLMIECYSRSKDADELNQALTIFDSVESDVKSNCIQHAIRVHISLGNYVRAEVLINENKQLDIQLLLAQLLRKQNKLNDALNILEKSNSKSSEWWIELGTIYQDVGNIDKSLMPLLTAAKLEPYNFHCFVHLGHYYRKMSDLDKARRCYEKAFRINTKCVEAGVELSGIYRQLHNWDANLALLNSLTEGAIYKDNSWAWLQLGLTYLEQGEYGKAIDNLRFVIRIDGNNTHCWESLADAYLARGAYTSALKCYEKALELGANDIYPTLQIANIKKTLGNYCEARLDFEKILLNNKHYIPALKGVAQTSFLQAQESLKDHRLGTARDHVQFAVDKLIIAIQHPKEYSCIWKLLGDCCQFVGKLPDKFCCLLVLSVIYEGKEAKGNTILEKTELFTLAIRCYCKSLSLVEGNTYIWHDLACCYVSYGLNADNEADSGPLFEKATAAARHCISLDGSNADYWNLLGNIFVHKKPPNYALAQHAFIKAVSLNNNNAIAWCNLGSLYLILDAFKLANEAFSQAQRSDPNYVNSWIGQALLAENLQHEDAMDLFRHSTQLAGHQQGALGYGHWVCKTLIESDPNAIIYSIHNMHAIPVACDALTWYIEKNPADSTAWNMLGILQERSGLKIGAKKSFRNALNLSKQINRDSAKINYGRLLTKLGKYSEAIDVFSSVENANFHSGCGLALALFKDQHFEESYEAYDSALHWLADDERSQSELLVALASMAYMFQGPDAAKTLLFQSVQLKQPSPWGFYATLSLALLHGDQKLAQLVFDELQQFRDRKECVVHFATLWAYMNVLRGDRHRAIIEVMKIVHRHPDQAAVWLLLSTISIRLRDRRVTAAAKCAQTVMQLGQTNMDMTKILCLVSLASFLCGNQKQALLAAQKAVHCYPDVTDGWKMLVSALAQTKTKTDLIQNYSFYLKTL